MLAPRLFPLSQLLHEPRRDRYRYARCSGVSQHGSPDGVQLDRPAGGLISLH